MKINVDFLELKAQREAIGATLSDWRIGSTNLDPRSALLDELGFGIEIDLTDVSVGPGKLLTYKGEQVLLYIKDTRSSLWTLHNEPEKSRRFHIADCTTLETMRNQGRFERYVVTNRMDGFFRVDWLDPDTGSRGETEAALKVCKYCLRLLDWRGYEKPENRLKLAGDRVQEKNAVWAEFSIPEFLMEYSTFFRNKPNRRDTNASLNVYVADWPAISEAMRSVRNWSCEKCSVNLSHYPSMLHCHHKNGNVTDNSAANLQVLCALCHAGEPGHQHMKISSTVTRSIMESRAAQLLRVDQ